MLAILVSVAVTFGYLVLGVVLFRLGVLYLNRSNVSGKEFTVHDAMDKIYADPSALPVAIVLGSAVLSFSILVAAFIRG